MRKGKVNEEYQRKEKEAEQSKGRRNERRKAEARSEEAKARKQRELSKKISLFHAYKSHLLDIENLLPGFRLYAITKLSQNPKNFRTDWAEVFYRRVNKST